MGLIEIGSREVASASPKGFMPYRIRFQENVLQGGDCCIYFSMKWAGTQQVAKHKEITEYREVFIQVEKQRTIIKHDIDSGANLQIKRRGYERPVDKILDRAFESAKQHELKSGGCPQCTTAGRFFNLYELTEMEAALKAGTPNECSTLIGEIAKMTIKIILKEREREAQKAREGKPST